MAQSGFTPIQQYFSTTAAAAPSAGNLDNGELAINITDGRLFYKDNSGTVQVLATKDSSGGTFTNATVSGNLTLSGGTANGVAYLNGSKVLTTGNALTFNGTNLGLGTAVPAVKFDIVSNNNTSLASVLRVNSNNVAVSTSLAYDGLVGSGQLTVQAGTSSALIFGANAAEQMRLTSTGLGIGTSSPEQKLQVQGVSSFGYINSTGQGTSGLYLAGNSGSVSVTQFGGELRFNTGGTANTSGTGSTEKMRIDSSGNLGLGVTPSAWSLNTLSAMQIRNGGFYGFDVTEVGVAGNGYYGANAWRYIQTGGEATLASQVNGQHLWHTAPSGTAGNAISFTRAMTLDASGNLLVGTTATNPTSGGMVLLAIGAIQTSRGTTSTAGQIEFRNPNGIVGSIQTSASLTLYNTTSDYRLKYIAGPVTNSGAFIDSLNPVQGSWKADGSRFIGFLAHELQEASETVVGTGDKDGEEMQSIDYSNAELITNLVAEIQSLRKRLAAAGI